MPEVQVEGAVVPVDATIESRPDLFGVRGQFRPDGEGGILSRIQDDRPEYATPEASGIESGFYVGNRGLPWHVALARQLGTPELMQDAGRLLTAEEAIEAAGASWTVQLKPIRVVEGQTIPDQWATVRGDTGVPLGVVGRAYKVVQNRDAFAFADNLVDSGEAKYETGGLMRGGRWVFLSMELDHLGISVPRDASAYKTYLLVSTSHDGSRPTEAHITHVRTVCRNTWKLAVAGAQSSFRIRHTGTIEGKLAAAREALGIAFRNVEATQEMATALSLKDVVDSQVQAIYESLWPVEDEATEAQRARGHAALAFENYLGSTTLDGLRGSAWGAFQNVLEYLDHEVTYRGKGRASDGDVRFNNLMFGSGADTTQSALDAVLAL